MCAVVHTSLASSPPPLHLQVVFKPYMAEFLGALSAHYNASQGLARSAASKDSFSAIDSASASSGSSQSPYTASGPVPEERQLPVWAAAVLQTVERKYLHLGELQRHDDRLWNGCVTLCFDLLTLWVRASCRGEAMLWVPMIYKFDLLQGFPSMRRTSAGCGNITHTGEFLCSWLPTPSLRRYMTSVKLHKSDAQQ